MKESCEFCKYMIKLYKHPNNKTKIVKGSIMEFSGLYACTVFQKEDETSILMKNIDNVCEYFIPNARWKAEERYMKLEKCEKCSNRKNCKSYNSIGYIPCPKKCDNKTKVKKGVRP